MSPEWIAVAISGAGLLGILAGVLVRGGRRDGKIDAVLEQLTKIIEDHEGRIRVLEHIRARR